MPATSARPNATYSPESGSASAGSRRGLSVSRVLWWGGMLALSALFASRYALRYFHFDAATYGPFWWARARLLLPHVIAGLAALFLGPLQFWSALRQRYVALHRWSGRAYLVGVAVGSSMACALIVRMPPGLAHAFGLAGLAAAWVLTSGTALIAIRRGNIAQHREWMVRSYVVTFAFVTYRALLDAMQALGVGGDADRRALVSWCCWAVPLLVTEVVLQGRKILRTPTRPIPALLE